MLLRTSPVQKTDTIPRCITRYHKPRDQQPASQLFVFPFFSIFFLPIHIVPDSFSLFSLHTENRRSIDVCLLSDYKYGRQRHQQIQLLWQHVGIFITFFVLIASATKSNLNSILNAVYKHHFLQAILNLEFVLVIWRLIIGVNFCYLLW